MNLIIEHLNGNIYSLIDLGISIVSFKIGTPTMRNHYEEIDYRDGLINNGTTYGERTISSSFEFASKDHFDFPQVRNQLFKVFVSKDPYYITDTREPHKRWLVKPGSFTPEQVVILVGKFDIDFTCLFPYAESTITTLNPAQLEGFTQMSAPGEIFYRFTTNSFSIWNEGDIPIDPRTQPLIITFKGASSGLRIKNLTSGDEWVYQSNTIADDTIRLDGIRSFKQDVSIFGQTNKKLIILVPGWNSFEITGATSPFEISFDFRFYYL
jgi:phage-related protein